jgi:SAM-dependent methyltransferase
MSDEANSLKRIRNALRFRQRLQEFCNRLLRRAGFLGGEWADALPEELRFWENALKEEGRHWVRSEYQKRMDPQCELQDDLKRLIQAPQGAVVRVLDVGAGPLSSLGKKWEGRTLQLFPVDPLAAEYKAILTRLKIRPPIFTEAGHGEKLLDRFNQNYFDLAFASNSLDHSYDPLLAIRQMFAVVKPQCYVYLWHFANVGVVEGYKGMHQWNFDIKHGDMILSNGRGVLYSLATEFQNVGALECEFQSFRGTKVVVSKLKKLAVAEGKHAH